MKEQNLENMIWEGRGKKTQQNSDRDNSNLCEIHNNLSAQCACFEILQYNTLVPCADGTNDSSTKRLMFQVLFFFIVSYRLGALKIYKKDEMIFAKNYARFYEKK